jgi:hypothetical protein
MLCEYLFEHSGGQQVDGGGELVVRVLFTNLYIK